ncbi:MAG: hypothetical protein NTV72_02220 [Candidatus Taylorbacteria bacterium]|nr:hypothetical protein [Candidatus Taylorbacteria bacterium]
MSSSQKTVYHQIAYLNHEQSSISGGFFTPPAKSAGITLFTGNTGSGMYSYVFGDSTLRTDFSNIGKWVSLYNWNRAGNGTCNGSYTSSYTNPYKFDFEVSSPLTNAEIWVYGR